MSDNRLEIYYTTKRDTTKDTLGLLLTGGLGSLGGPSLHQEVTVVDKVTMQTAVGIGVDRASALRDAMGKLNKP